MDLISREAVIGEMDKRHADGDYITKGFIKSLPSAFEGMTYGDVIEALFPMDRIYKGDHYVEVVFKGAIQKTYFTREFWDSSYKGVSE